MRPTFKKQQGFIVISTLISIPCLLILLLGSWGLSQYWLSKLQLQISSSSGALAGAAQLGYASNETVIATAEHYCRLNAAPHQLQHITATIGHWNNTTHVFSPLPLPPMTPANAVSVSIKIETPLPEPISQLSTIHSHSIAVSPLTTFSSTSYLVK